MAGIFGGIGSAKASRDGNYIRPSNFWGRIDRCKVDKNRKNETIVAIEMTVVKMLDDSNNHKPNEEVTHLLKPTGPGADYFKPELKAFMVAVLGIEEGDYSDDDYEKAAEEIFGPDNPLEGTVIEVFARNVVTQDGGDFTKIKYRAEVPPQKLLEELTEQEQERFFPNKMLQKKVEAMKKATA